jgi:hypothetical protein
MIAFFAEDLSLIITGVVPYTQLELLRISLLVPACASLLLTEYRLTVPNLIASILAMVLTGIARALWKTVVQYYPETVADNINQSDQLAMIQTLVGVIWVLVFWTGDPIFALDIRNIPLLAINALASALTLRFGNSMLLPMRDEVPGTDIQSLDAPVRHSSDALVLSTLAGIVGCYSTLAIRRSYTSVYQVCSFLFVVLCIYNKGRFNKLDARPRRFWIIHSNWEFEDLHSMTSTGNDDDNRTTNSTFSSNSRKHKFHGSLRYIGVALLWTTYGVLNFTERPGSHVPVLLDRDYVSILPVEIVLSMYKEPVDGVRKLISNLKSVPALSDARFTIYIKDSGADNEYVKQRTGADRVATLRNIGREGETYLNHILNEWHSLARQTIFLQADIHNSKEFFTHLNNYYSRFHTGFLSLGWSGTVCNCESCGDRFFWQDNTHLFPQIHAQMNNSTTCDNVLLNYKGQFIVSAARIRGINKEIYHSLWRAFVDEKGWAHQSRYLQGRPDSMSAPDFGYTMERMWNLLFQCSNMEVAWKCPSLVSGWRIGGDISDCQCLDT